MSLRLYLDECAYSKRLRNILRSPPWHHQVGTPVETGLVGRSDQEHLDHARQSELVLVTKNPADFLFLHNQDPSHPGIIVIYQDNRPTDLPAPAIARAIHHLEVSGTPLPGGLFVLNAWNY